MLTIANQETLILYLIASHVLVSPKIIEAFSRVDRADFVLPQYEKEAYGDYPLPIGFGQSISQPSTIAFMLELLDPRSESIILEIGAWSGWVTTLLAEIVENYGFVTGLEIIPELLDTGKKNLEKYPFRHVGILQAGKELGIPGDRFDRILVSAGAETFPDQILDQLNNDGRLVIPVGKSIFLCSKDFEGTVHTREFPGFDFVPLKV